MTTPFKVEGVDYSPEGVAGLRAALVEMRGATFAHWPEAIDHTVVLTHAIALLSYTIELQRQMEPVDWSQVARNLLEAMKQDRFECPAVITHGPGHMSTTKCERHDPHGLDDEHYADNPMTPGFVWHGATEAADPYP